ncbi:MAG: recombination protein O N-terminal domain-containing protein, partial [Deltaproteobacteria bacterium]|nr:recombination protein O N-terminal domain-containing protein [Deltaproteobacteria bacterium]
MSAARAARRRWTGPPSRPRRLEAVVLSRWRTGEQDLLVSFLTPELGLLSAIAKNAVRSVRRFGGGLLDPGSSAFFEFQIRGDSDFGLVARGERGAGSFTGLPKVPVMQALAGWALELVRAFESPRTPAREPFVLLAAHLKALARESWTPPALAARSLSLGFTARYLEIAGFAPPIRSCRRCGKPPSSGEWAWDAVDPRAFCQECLPLIGPLASLGLAPVPGRLLAAINALSPDVVPTAPLSREEAALAEAYFWTLSSSVSGKGFLSRMSLERYLEEPGTATQSPDGAQAAREDRYGPDSPAGPDGNPDRTPDYTRRHEPPRAPTVTDSRETRGFHAVAAGEPHSAQNLLTVPEPRRAPDGTADPQPNRAPNLLGGPESPKAPDGTFSLQQNRAPNLLSGPAPRRTQYDTASLLPNRAPNLLGGPASPKAPDGTAGLLQNRAQNLLSGPGPRRTQDDTASLQPNRVPNLLGGAASPKAPDGTAGLQQNRAQNLLGGPASPKAPDGTADLQQNRAQNLLGGPASPKAPDDTAGLLQNRAQKHLGGPASPKAPDGTAGLQQNRAPTLLGGPASPKAPDGTADLQQNRAQNLLGGAASPKAPDGTAGLQQNRAQNHLGGPASPKAPDGTAGLLQNRAQNLLGGPASPKAPGGTAGLPHNR